MHSRPSRTLVAAFAAALALVASSTAHAQHASGGSAAPTRAAAPVGAPLSVEIPLVYVDGRILLPATLDGVGERWFILDTAAGGSVVSTRLRAELGPEAAVRRDTVRGASGASVMEFVALPGLEAAGLRREGLWGVVADIPDFQEVDGRRVEGVLGVDLYLGYDVEIDVPGGALRLTRPTVPGVTPSAPGVSHPACGVSRSTPGGPEAPPAGAALPFHSSAQDGFLQFEARVAGHAVDAILDTGSRWSVLNWRAADLAGVTRESPGLEVRERGSRGLGGEPVETFWYDFPDLRIGDVPLPGRARIADLPVFHALGHADDPVLLVGAEILERCVLHFSYATGRLTLCPSGRPVNRDP
ncbi:MAG: aspartyl protease family protein [Gemmatimonadota bacterium]